jgi:hypothetical protein
MLHPWETKTISEQIIPYQLSSKGSIMNLPPNNSILPLALSWDYWNLSSFNSTVRV